MKILVIGSGGREHAIIKKLLKDRDDLQIFCAPGNGGIGQDAICVNIDAMDIEQITAYAKTQAFDLVVVAPDDPLAAGLVDVLESNGIRAFGPSKEAAQIESSKAFAKALMKKHEIPTAEYAVFEEYEAASAYIKKATEPMVVKADGLAKGKGVLICETRQEAEDAVRQMMQDKAFGEAGSRVIIEEFIEGPEVSVLSFCDGKTIVPLPSAQDHKKALDGDMGKNTGGMGAFSPSDKYTPDIKKIVEETIIYPTFEALNAEGITYKGVIYFGIMLTADGPKVLEYNARFGDPEIQIVLPKVETDLVGIMDAVIDQRLADVEFVFNPDYGVCVVLASGGYPDAYMTGYPITGLDKVDDDIVVYHAGTKSRDRHLYTKGGRVLNIAAFGRSMEEAREKVYKNIKKISFENMHYRTDIGIK